MLKDLGRRKDRHVVFSKINSCFEYGDQVDQLLFDRLQASGECAFELLGRNFRLVQRLRVDQIADGFGLSEINATVEKGAHGELAGFGETGAAL